MQRHIALLATLALAACGQHSGDAGPAESAAARPNIVFVLIDEPRYADALAEMKDELERLLARTSQQPVQFPGSPIS